MNENKCRICLVSTNLLLSLFHGSESTMISSKIMNLANIEIYPHDGLPATICVSCTQKLDECIEFINLCKKSDNDLRNKTSNVIVEEKNIGSKNNDSELKLSSKVICILDTEVTDVTQKVSAEDHTINTSEHRKLSQKQQCFTCGKLMSSRFRLKTHLATHIKEKQHSCTYCKKQFTIIENLNAHMRTHTGEKPYCCDTCGERFAQSSGLIVHKRKHTGQTPYQCVLCPRSFQTIGNFKYHIRVHTGERKFDCNTCGRAFITNGDLKQHIATHSGEKPHICSICGVRFSRASNLKRHVIFLHNEEKCLPCNYCPSKFARKIDLLKHEKCHRNK
ncbi:zinc finger protein 239-like [Bicyclus anynana]|uniref:Zinc finger protein 239-like n=1 Tax=Bicyclus anynana TaxID=110368 RepID=A0A6J1MZB6_BICAN|nr:zinc finger protein 239-like [Bicyclus anynana]